MKRSVIFGLGCLLLAGCPRNGGPPPDGTTGTPTASVPVPAPTTSPRPASEPSSPVPAPTGEPSPTGITLGQGTYTSKACGERKYDRVARIGKGNTIELDDRVSPCPKGTACVWSGIVTRKGTYEVEGPGEMGKPYKLMLTFDKAEADRGALAAPTHLEWYESRGVLTGPGDTCPYTRR